MHKWKPEEQLVGTEETVALFTAIYEGKLPESVELCASYGTLAQRAFCVWKACSKEDLEKLFEQHAPTLKRGTEIVPVVQSYPPTVEYVLSLVQSFIKMA